MNLGCCLSSATSDRHECEDCYQKNTTRVRSSGADKDTVSNSDSVEASCRPLKCTCCPKVRNRGFVSSVPSGYLMVGTPIVSPNGAQVTLRKASGSGSSKWGKEYKTLVLQAEFQSNDRLRIKITPNDGSNRFEVPIEILPATGGNANPLYDIQFSNDPLFAFKVIRKATGTVLFDTSVGQKNFVYADQYLSLTWSVPSEQVYGIGENEQTSFKHDFSANKTYPLWARDHSPEGTGNIYGVQPYYTVLEKDGNAHSVALVNSNAQEFSMKTGGVISYITIGGVMDLFFFLGPTPENTVQQYTVAVGRAPMPPYWSLGFQLSRWGYNNLTNMKAAVDRMEKYGIPHDVQYGDIDIMDRQLDFTYAPDRFAGLPEYIRDLKKRGIKFVTILDPGISTGEPAGSYRPYNLGEQMDVWVKRADGSNAQGKVWPTDNVVFPDYSKSSAREWWITLIREFHDLLEYDGLWIDMNEPSNFVDGDVNGNKDGPLTNPPYVPPVFKDNLSTRTLSADTVQDAGKHYDVHSLYGWFQSEPTLIGIVSSATTEGTGKRSLVLSRSTFLGSGKWAAHWLGDNFSRWSNLYFSIIGMLQFNHFGIPMCGADIGGFFYNATSELCQRWQELGAFYPFSRNHNAKGNLHQDPGVFGPAVAASSRTALRIRYTLLPYLYTLFHLHHIRGDTVARALWHEFPTDSTAAGIDRQFLWGSGFLVSPVLDQGATSVEAYFPDSRWFSYYNGQEEVTRGGTVTLNAPLDFIPLHVHGGNILPTQEPARNTELARSNPFGLIVALDDNGSAQGSLYYDDGNTIDPHADGNFYYAEFNYSTVGVLTSSVVTNGYSEMSSKTLDKLRLFGSGTITRVQVNGASVSFTQNPSTKEVTLNKLGLSPSLPFTINFV